MQHQTELTMTYQVPDHIANRNRRGIADQASTGIGTGMPPYISIKANRFTLFDAAGNSRPVETYDPQLGPILDCIVVDANQKVSKIYYAEAWDPENPAPPDCWSDNGIAPSISAEWPQWQTCEACPHNKWGSAISALNGAKIKACDDYKKFAIFLPSLPDMLFQMRVPPASLKGLKKYMEQFKGQNFDLPDVYTRVRFDLSANGILVFEPSPLGFVSADIVAKCDQIDQTKLDNLVGRSDTPIRDALPAPTIAQTGVRPDAAPQIVPQPAPAPTQPAPAFGAPAPAPAPAAPFGVPQQAPAAPRGRGRPRKVANAVPTAPAPAPTIARTGVRPDATPPATFGGAPQTGFGAPAAPFGQVAPPPQSTAPGGTPPAANPELEKALASAFGLPTH
jgi:hypothetical protein